MAGIVNVVYLGNPQKRFCFLSILTGLAWTGHGRRFIVLIHQFGRRDVTLNRSLMHRNTNSNRRMNLKYGASTKPEH